MRVVAGSVGGRRLVAPAGSVARPTTDRVKESVFSALGDARLADAVVLDLFAGSGALAIEALSRGAAQAVLVDRTRAAVTAIERNLATTAFTDRARVRQTTVEGFVRHDPPAEAPFDLVLIDPPYDLAAAVLTDVLAGLARPGWLAPGASVVLERRVGGEAVPALPAGWESAWERTYGDTLVTIAAPEQAAPEKYPEE